jgi:DNA (cytosine-5)-methyltransferase 1
VKFLSLFAGIGGFDLGLEHAGMQPVGQVEINPFCQRVLAHHWPNVKRMGDIKNVKGTEFGEVDLVCGGVPCQPASTAGKRRGTADDRWLWPEAFRLVRVIQPRWCLFENVRGITSLESGVVFDSLLTELETYGYEVQSFCVPACAVDAPHRRDRVWIIAYNAKSTHRQNITGEKERQVQQSGIGIVTADVADADNSGFKKQCGTEPRESLQSQFACRWFPEPDVGRVANGVPGRVDRLRSLGNAVVPQIVEIFGRVILEASGKT